MYVFVHLTNFHVRVEKIIRLKEKTNLIRFNRLISAYVESDYKKCALGLENLPQNINSKQYNPNLEASNLLSL